ncbi:MAG: type II 3-dehydroquinate dehydratase [Robiginitomaculum sp.]|nr:MAG: type II 3-dehydroquinate dehydratase [Robiginitomaculum sp.]
MSKPIYILNGPNLNRLGSREPDIYGTTTLADIERSCRALAQEGDVSLTFCQTNDEGELVTLVQEAADKASALILNAAAYTHTSIALLDALKLLEIPIIEVHLSNPAAREPFRQTNYVSPAATSGIFGFGAVGYEMAVRAVLRLLA